MTNKEETFVGKNGKVYTKKNKNAKPKLNVGLSKKSHVSTEKPIFFQDKGFFGRKWSRKYKKGGTQ